MKPEDARSERSDGPAPDDSAAHPAEAGLWAQVLARENLALALRRVERNAGASGIDGMVTRELRRWLKEHWPGVRAALDAGTYVLQRALPNAYWISLGLLGFTDPYHRLRDATRTAGCGPACPVVWEGPG